MLTRSIVAATLIVGTGVYARGPAGPERAPARTLLAATPTVLGSWTGQDVALSDEAIAGLGVDDYINRTYVAEGAPPISLYIGYYVSQRQGDLIHSPRNCLPGAGWQPISFDRGTVDAGTSVFPVNHVVIQKGVDRQAVVYWYQGRGRIVANEFANKGWQMLDAARLRRTDGGLVRLIAPVDSTPGSAFASLAAFSASLLPHLSAHLP
jgi:EpsI family protein